MSAASCALQTAAQRNSLNHLQRGEREQIHPPLHTGGPFPDADTGYGYGHGGAPRSHGQGASTADWVRLERGGEGSVVIGGNAVTRHSSVSAAAVTSAAALAAGVAIGAFVLSRFQRGNAG